ncbi:MAG: ABC transporter ATP-binding protein [Pseudanabaenales cyanobacterium]|nr:ABC transporter ATP-binding protein [Pseudanabaenales cyanobacterium]
MTNIPVIKTDQLTKQFDDYAAVNKVNLEVQAGEIYGLIGPNGAGKTTMIRMLAMAADPTTGDIYIDGKRLIRGHPDPEIKRYIGFLPDDFPLYNDLSVQDYLEYFGQLYYLPTDQIQPRIKEVLNLVSLETKCNSLIGGLSRGMKQRLSLARTVIHRPRLLLLDEPVSGLDPIARIEYRATIKLLHQQGVTILISSHILSDLEDFCTSIGIMEQGRLVQSSQLQALYQQDGQQQILIAVLDDLSRVETHLQNHPLVQAHVRIAETGKLGVTFTGAESDAADLLSSLVQAGIRVSEFHRMQETLEDVFIKLGYQHTA